MWILTLVSIFLSQDTMRERLASRLLNMLTSERVRISLYVCVTGLNSSFYNAGPGVQDGERDRYVKFWSGNQEVWLHFGFC